jgi:hypothetical protein
LKELEEFTLRLILLMMAFLKLVTLVCLAVAASAWPWSDYELNKASRSDLEKYANRILIENERSETDTLKIIQYFSRKLLILYL